jgi:hypothetical protein
VIASSSAPIKDGVIDAAALRAPGSLLKLSNADSARKY